MDTILRIVLHDSEKSRVTPTCEFGVVCSGVVERHKFVALLSWFCLFFFAIRCSFLFLRFLGWILWLLQRNCNVVSPLSYETTGACLQYLGRFPHAHTNAYAPLPTHSLTHSLTHPPTHSPTHSLTTHTHTHTHTHDALIQLKHTVCLSLSGVRSSVSLLSLDERRRLPLDAAKRVGWNRYVNKLCQQKCCEQH